MRAARGRAGSSDGIRLNDNVQFRRLKAESAAFNVVAAAHHAWVFAPAKGLTARGGKSRQKRATTPEAEGAACGTCLQSGPLPRLGDEIVINLPCLRASVLVAWHRSARKVGLRHGTSLAEVAHKPRIEGTTFRHRKEM
jgi:hypothetical protein